MTFKKNRLHIFSSICFILALCLSCKETKEVHKKEQNKFVKIFDGKTLNGWEGDPKYWSVENGNLVGTVTPKTLLKRNTFIIWQGGQPDNFELKLEYRISESGNSGINYRSEAIDGVSFALRGYQCDIDGKQRYTGQNYEERKRTTLAYRGENVVINTQLNPDPSGSLRSNVKKNCWQSRDVIGSLGSASTLKEKIKKGDWNQVHLIITENKLLHYVNGTLMSQVTDKDAINSSLKGYIGVQVHKGPPMQVEFREIQLKKM